MKEDGVLSSGDRPSSGVHCEPNNMRLMRSSDLSNVPYVSRRSAAPKRETQGTARRWHSIIALTLSSLSLRELSSSPDHGHA